MDLSIVILNYKQKGLVKQCVKGIIAAAPQLDYEIIVVDNNSQDDCLSAVSALCTPAAPEPLATPSLLGRFEPALPPLRTIQSPQNGGFAVGNNLGVRAARGAYVLVMNPDIAVVAGGLEKMVALMEAQPQIGVVSPKLINPDGSIQDSCRRFPSWPMPLYRRTVFGKLPWAKKKLGYYLMADWDHASSRPIDWLFGACLLLRASALDKVGLFDERFFMYFEDLDLCRRFWEAGYSVYYFADVELVHYHQRLSAERGGVIGLFNRAGRIHLMSGIKYFAKYFGAKLPQH